MQEINNQEQLSAWVREQFQKANKHLAENQILFDTVVTEESRYLAPHVAVWKIKDNTGAFYWVVSGDVPSDYVELSVAKDARSALNHFSLSWQMTSENLERSANGDAEQLAFAKRLRVGAENLYEVAANEKIWQPV